MASDVKVFQLLELSLTEEERELSERKARTGRILGEDTDVIHVTLEEMRTMQTQAVMDGLENLDS